MKKASPARKAPIKQKANSRKPPTAGAKTTRPRKASKRVQPDLPTPSLRDEEPPTPTSRLQKSRADAVERMRKESAQAKVLDVVDEIAQELDGKNGQPQAKGFHLPNEETRKEHQHHEKGYVEGAAMLSHIPPAKSPGQPGSPPRIRQRRAVHERGNRYPLTHAPKA